MNLTSSKLRALGLLFLGALAACSAGDDESEEMEGASEGALTGNRGAVAPEVDDAISRIAWQTVGNGVSYKPVDPSRANVLIIYGGFSAQELWVRRWCDQMIRVKNDFLGIGHLYAVQGPDTPLYKNHEIGNSKLAAHLGAEGRAQNAGFVAVIAHSSGTYVADELMGQLKNGAAGAAPAMLGKIEYFNLDGGGPGDSSLLERYAHVHFVYGHDARIKRDSRNANGMKSLGKKFASLGGVVEVDAEGSGCDPSASGGAWCMHDTLINTKPHNPQMFDLARDYTDFSGSRSLVTSYLDSLSPAAPQ